MHPKLEEILAILRESGCLQGKLYSCGACRDGKLRFAVLASKDDTLFSRNFWPSTSSVKVARDILFAVREKERERLLRKAADERKSLTFRPAVGGFDSVTGAIAPMRKRRSAVDFPRY